MMNLWTMIVSIVAICVIGDIIKSRYKNMGKSTIPNNEILEHLNRLKTRIENLETIVIEKEKNRRFEGLGDN